MQPLIYRKRFIAIIILGKYTKLAIKYYALQIIFDLLYLLNDRSLCE